MTGSTTTAESHSEDPGRCLVFIMRYDPDEYNVLQAWDTKMESEDSKTKQEVCIATHAVGNNRGSYPPSTDGNHQAILPEGNPLGAGQGGIMIQPQQLQCHLEERLSREQSLRASSPRPLCHTNVPPL